MNFEQVYSEAIPLADLLVRSAGRFPDRVALVVAEESLTYTELLARSAEVARGLASLGVGRGDNVGVLAPNSQEFAEAVFGIALLGAVVVPLNVRHRSSELGYVIDHAELKAIVTTDRMASRTDLRQVLRDAIPGLDAAPGIGPLLIPSAPHLRHIVVLGGKSTPGFVGDEEFRRAAAAVRDAVVETLRHRVRVRDCAMILYTSGTTAHPKGCMITHEAVTRAPVGRTNAAIPRPWRGDPEVVWCPAPFFHIAAFQGLIWCLAQGGTMLTDVHLDGERAFRSVRDWHATSLWPMFMAPQTALMEAPGFHPEELPHVRSIVTVGAPNEFTALQEAFPQALLINGSGMTEMTGHFCLTSPSDSLEIRATTSGRPVAGAEVRIVDSETNEDLPDGELGELLVRGYSMMSGYYRDPERTAEAIDHDGWLHTGDLFRRLASGHLRFEGRLKDMLKVGGENVPAIEVESFLKRHPSVLNAEVVGRPDARLDEVPVAFVELRPGTQVSEEELVQFCVGRLASFKIPRAVYFKAADEWPMSATKVNKVALRREVLALVTDMSYTTTGRG
ncbi:class I adenylate-forming enzyme family protein [Streptomyces carpinensis]|uniref:Class I adenylate-forming enzyme family protein n=1 Tax=Streptomyces carpinensis TaxID=66369 RepID=A0ABV1VUR0_9ACTN|nr:class I adenylate-forming enzyme family protein [Streptomyces carpinensis]